MYSSYSCICEISERCFLLLYQYFEKSLQTQKKGYNTLGVILKNAGIDCNEIEVKSNEVFFLRDNQLIFPVVTKDRLVKKADGWALDIYVFSPRPLDDLLIEPNMPKLTLVVKAKECQLAINDKSIHCCFTKQTRGYL